MEKPICVIAGAGPGNGLALHRAFQQAGYRTVLLARDEARAAAMIGPGEEAMAIHCDLSDAAHNRAVAGRILAEVGVPAVVIYNAGAGMWGSPLETSLEDFETAWRINAAGLLVLAQALCEPMIKAGGGCLIVSGATASLRGGARFAAFSSAKAAQRNLAQSLARDLGPRGVHVALVIIDGVIDLPRTRELFPDQPDSFFLQPAAIAQTYLALVRQSPSAWTFEVDLRPQSERW